jgi:hypothetical protein
MMIDARVSRRGLADNWSKCRTNGFNQSPPAPSGEPVIEGAADEDNAKLTPFDFVRAGILLPKAVSKPVGGVRESIRRIIDLSAALSVALDIAPEPFASYVHRMNHVVEPGGFELMVSNSSTDDELQW